MKANKDVFNDDLAEIDPLLTSLMGKNDLKIKKEVDILIVEDSITQAEQLKHLLEKNQYSVTIADNGLHALDILEQYDPAIIISDICMPEMDGYELCRRIKARDRKQDIPVILLTSLSNPEDVIEGLECGADNFITKPYAEDYLLSHVERVMASLKFYQTERVRIGVEIMFAGKRRLIKADMRQMLTLLMSTYEAAVIKNKELLIAQDELQTMNDNLEEKVEVRTLELKKNEQKYQDLYDNAPAMFMSVEYLTGKVLECNETLLRKTGFKRSEVIGEHVFKRFHPDCLDSTERTLKLFKETGEIKSSELELITTNGGKVTVLLNSTAVRNDQGDILLSRSVLQDISELKQTQQRLMRAKEKAVESDQLKTAFLANMSHEIRTPMNGILGFSQLLKDPDLSLPDKDEYINIIDKCSHQLLHIITDIVDISKIEAGQETTSLEAFNLIDLLEEVIDLFQPQADQQNLKISRVINLPSNLVNIFSDPVKLRQILCNLIGNALKFTEAGTIEIKVEAADNQLLFSIKDTGIGIDPSLHESIFDRFRQVEIENTRKYGGTGLGLSLSKSYIEMLGGTIWLESYPGIGSTFSFEIPLTKALDSFEKDWMENEAASFDNAWRGKTILLIEDEETNLFFIHTLLRSTGINVLYAQNGLDAVDQCEKNNDISIILMEINLSEKIGMTATRIIKSFRESLPIIAITAHPIGNDKEKCLDAGCDDFLSKPIKKDQLINMIANYLS